MKGLSLSLANPIRLMALHARWRGAHPRAPPVPHRNLVQVVSQTGLCHNRPGCVCPQQGGKDDNSAAGLPGCPSLSLATLPTWHRVSMARCVALLDGWRRAAADCCRLNNGSEDDVLAQGQRLCDILASLMQARSNTERPPPSA